MYNELSLSPHKEIRDLIIRLRFLKRTYGITESEIYDIRWYLDQLERDFMKKKPTMNEDIKKYPIFTLTDSGKLIRVDWIKSTANYNHYEYNLHHFIKDYHKNQSWYDERSIKQKLILVPIELHEQIHNQAIKNLNDEEFLKEYKISRWELIFNRKHSEY